MDKKEIRRSRIGHVVTLLLLLFLTALAALGLTMGGHASASSAVVDSDAMGALSACRAYCESHDFTTTADGTIKARAFGIPYSQKVVGSRVKRGTACTETAESYSSLAKAALKKETDVGSFRAADGKFDGGKATYGTPKEYTEGGFVAAYGKPNIGLIKYELDGAITEATAAGEGVYTFKLDPARATAFCRNEIKTTVNCKTHPEYESVEFTLYTDGERPIKVTSVEKFHVDKFGGTSCTTEFTEIFNF